MANYKNLLDVFGDSKDQDKAELFLKKYWLDEERYMAIRPVQDKIFHPNSAKLCPPLFLPSFHQLLWDTGLIFIDEDLSYLKKIAQITNDSYFIIIQNIDKTRNPIITVNEKIIKHPQLNFIFPINITWEELNSGGGISKELFRHSYKDYYVFTDTGKWGKYVAGDNFFSIIGCKPEYLETFRHYFKLDLTEQFNILKNAPIYLKEYLKTMFY